MSIEAEFIVQTEPFQHVKLTFRGETIEDLRADMSRFNDARKEELGDYWVSLKAAVLYGRDQALKGVEGEAERLQSLLDDLEKEHGPLSPEEIAKAEEKWLDTAQEGAVEAVKEGLGAITLSEEEKPAEGPSRPWKNKPKTAKKKAWEDPVTEGPAATPEKSVTATKAAHKAAAASDWDF